jgi:hypothetical protein
VPTYAWCIDDQYAKWHNKDQFGITLKLSLGVLSILHALQGHPESGTICMLGEIYQPNNPGQRAQLPINYPQDNIFISSYQGK